MESRWRKHVPAVMGTMAVLALGVPLCCCGSKSDTPALSSADTHSGTADSGAGSSGTVATAGSSDQSRNPQGDTGAPSGTGGSGGTSSGGAGGTSAGGALQSSSTLAGDAVGPALHVTGSALAATGNLLDRTASTLPSPAGPALDVPADKVSAAGVLVAHTGTSLQRGGLGGLPVAGDPLSGVIGRGDNTINPLAKVTVDNHTVIGSPNPNSVQLVNASVLSAAAPNHSAVGVGALSNGKVLSAVVDNPTQKGLATPHADDPAVAGSVPALGKLLAPRN